jgi:dsDNA-specific endonuclease/ATPase MutS2
MTRNEDSPEPAGDAVAIPIEDCIDLHAFQPRDVASLVEEYLHQARRRGFRQVRIIHGRGTGVQRAIVQSILRRDPGVLSFSDAADLGATVVILLLP